MSLGVGGLAAASRPRPQAMAVVRNAAGTKRKVVFMVEWMKRVRWMEEEPTEIDSNKKREERRKERKKQGAISRAMRAMEGEGRGGDHSTESIGGRAHAQLSLPQWRMSMTLLPVVRSSARTISMLLTWQCSRSTCCRFQTAREWWRQSHCKRDLVSKPPSH